jgi:hypothetical protein
MRQVLGGPFGCRVNSTNGHFNRMNLSGTQKVKQRTSDTAEHAAQHPPTHTHKRRLQTLSHVACVLDKRPHQLPGLPTLKAHITS